MALTIEQVWQFNLQPSMDAKIKSPGYKNFVERYGITDAYELEALEPADLIGLLRSAIDNVIDVDLYNQARRRGKRFGTDHGRSRTSIAVLQVIEGLNLQNHP
jgi:hypothetical protein